MADKKISQLTALSGANVAPDDLFAIVDTNANETKSIRADEVFKSLSAGTAAAPAIVPAGDQNTGIFFPAADTVAISNNGVESLRINASRQVGINTISPGWPLDITCDGSAFGLRSRGRAADNISVLRFTSNDAATTYFQFDVRSSQVLVNAVANIPIVFLTNNTDRGRFDTSGNFSVANGNFVPSTAAKGVNFTANTPAAGMTSQLLNWYEEGTWTPAFTFSTSQGDMTYGVQSGYYTRIGRVVQLNCFVRVTETTASGNITITGLPFTSANITGNAAAGVCFVDNVTGVSGAVVAQLNANSSTITLFYTGTGSATQLSNANTGTNSSFQFTVSYLV